MSINGSLSTGRNMARLSDIRRWARRKYRLTSRWDGRGVYTFCMCPGGEVICSATEPDGVAVNGMSYYARGWRKLQQRRGGGGLAG